MRQYVTAYVYKYIMFINKDKVLSILYDISSRIKELESTFGALKNLGEIDIEI